MRNCLMIFVLLLITSAAAAASFDRPKRKSGLWEIKISNARSKGSHAMQQCVDEKIDDLMKKEVSDSGRCSKNEVHKDGDAIIAESVCKIQNSTAKTRAVYTGNFDSAYKADIHSTYEPPLSGIKQASSVIEAKWLGPCKAGQKPGDMVIPGMPSINMDAMRKGASKGP